MNLNEMFPSNYLSKDDFPTPRVLVMTKVTKDDVWRKNGKQMTAVLHFQGSKSMILNKTNALVIGRLYGPDTAAWIGKPIEIYHDPNVMLGRDRVGGIRVRIPTGPRAAAGGGTSAANGATPKAAPAPAPSPSAPPPTLDQRLAQLLAGFDGALTDENLTAWGRWGKQFPFSETQQGEAEDRFHDALARIALAQSPTRRPARASRVR
jgi:hypothetical protein